MSIFTWNPKTLKLDDTGMIHKENVMKSIDEDMPEGLKQKLSAQIGACLDEHGMAINW